MKNILKYLQFASAIFLLVFLGFTRDFFFVNLNYQLASLVHGNSSYRLPQSLQWLGRFDAWQLYYSKYIFTALSVLLFFLATLWAVHVFFHEKKYRRWVWFSYIIVTFASGLIFLALNWIIGFDDTYTIVRKVIDFAESPLIAMILFPVIVFHKKFTSGNK